MADRRMFSKTIVDSDAFLDMPLSSQALYFHLGMRADDDGFVNSPKKIQRVVGCSSDDLKLLAAKKFIIPFDNGVVVIKHWKINNYIKKDRYKPTVYREEMSQLTVKDNGSYTLNKDCIQDGNILEPKRIQCGTKVDTQDSIGKNSVDKNSIDTVCTEPQSVTVPDVPPLILNDGSEWFPTMEDFNEWIRIYPGVDVKIEFSRMRQWLLSNPLNRKTKRGIRKFAQTWLDREQNKYRSKGSGNPDKNPFNRIPQQNYNFNELEAQLLSDQPSSGTSATV